MKLSDEVLNINRDEIERHAALALKIVNILTEHKDTNGLWSSGKETGQMRYTCHAIDALSELRLPISKEIVERGITWLLEPRLQLNASDEEQDNIRLHPSRFKTLATLSRFNTPSVRQDFDRLTKKFDPRTGMLEDSPIPGRILSTMIWVETAVCLQKNDELFAWKQELDVSLDLLNTLFEEWITSIEEVRQAGGGDGGPNRLSRLRDASYAFELLVSSKRLTLDSLECLTAHKEFCRAIEQHAEGDDNYVDRLYCALQIVRHYGNDKRIRNIVSDLLGDIENQYESETTDMLDDFFHALALRVLINFHGGQQLRQAIFGLLLKSDRSYLSQQEDTKKAKTRQAFKNLITNRIEVALEQNQPELIAGSEERGAVYRIRFTIGWPDATDKLGRTYYSTMPPLSLVVKKGSYDALLRSIQQFKGLDPKIQPFFARHDDSMAQFNDSQEWYIVMEDLSEMSPLCEELIQRDTTSFSHRDGEELRQIVKTISDTLRALHSCKQSSPTMRDHFWRLYYVPITQSLERLCQTYPNFKRFINGRFTANNWTHRGIQNYLNRISLHAEKLSPPALGMIHGDCHSRNIMIDPKFIRAKLIDLEMLADDDDYITDYGLLLEDAAIYLYLPHIKISDHHNLSPNDIVFVTESSKTTGGDAARLPSNRIIYPPLPRDSRAIQLFQETLLKRLEEYAKNIGDDYWKERLWLAMARSLLVLGSRQLERHEKEPQGSDKRYKSILICFAEAARLLGELADRLSAPERGKLPSIPFSGWQREQSPKPPFRVNDLHRAIMRLDPENIIPFSPRKRKYITQYSIKGKAGSPFTEIDAGEFKKRKAAELFVAGSLPQFISDTSIAKVNATRGGLTILLTAETSFAKVQGLIREAYEIAKSSTV